MTGVLAAGLVQSAPPSDAAASRKQVKQQIRRAWEGNVKRAIRVADCESGLNPKATSPDGKYLGLWQFSRPTWREYGGPGNDPRKVNGYRQTLVAWRLFKDRRWAPWPTCGAPR